LAYIPPEDRIPGLEADLKSAREKFEKDPSEKSHAELTKAQTALTQTKGLMAGVSQIRTYQDRE
jgi:hypothetical protein